MSKQTSALKAFNKQPRSEDNMKNKLIDKSIYGQKYRNAN